jgi:hypothetical protein
MRIFQARAVLIFLQLAFPGGSRATRDECVRALAQVEFESNWLFRFAIIRGTRET